MVFFGQVGRYLVFRSQRFSTKIFLTPRPTSQQRVLTFNFKTRQVASKPCGALKNLGQRTEYPFDSGNESLPPPRHLRICGTTVKLLGGFAILKEVYCKRKVKGTKSSKVVGQLHPLKNSEKHRRFN